jgi:putative oxygen-independent coproporphyrinogen III oxidase
MGAHTEATLSHLGALVGSVQNVTAAHDSAPRLATSVFFGGGTPSLLPGHELARILHAIPRVDGCEVTVECNPDTVSPELFATYADAGVTRISFGVQSMVDHVLLALGRTHDRNNVLRGVEFARAAGLTFNLDLIYGGAGETLTDWESTVAQVLALEPPHVSAYALTIEAGTPLALDTSRHPDDDDLADKYLLATERFAAAGLANYEISNWSQPGRECRHNWLYWMQGDYIGVGCAAHSHEQGRRWWNLRTPERYVDAATQVAAGGDISVFTASSENLDPRTRELERLQLVLRTRLGVPVSSLPTSDREELAAWLDIDAADGRLRLTPEGRLLANEIANRLVVDLR